MAVAIRAVLAATMTVLVAFAATPSATRKVEDSRRSPATWNPAARPADSDCAQGMFTCLDGRCIPTSWLCDNDRDCEGGEDESHCPEATTVCNATSEHECHGESGMFHALAHFDSQHPRCIPKLWVCDGEVDCADQSDEMQCSGNITCAEDQFKCVATNAHPAICIPQSWRCDGQTDCADMSDETTNCTATGFAKKCNVDEIKCDNNVCIFKQWQCDGDNDCGDHSDERDCKDSCDPVSKFKCTNDFCIPSSWRCDGEHDCRDGSDEANCTGSPPSVGPHHTRTCHANEFKCVRSQQCINQAWVCDGEPDCLDGSDEDANCTIHTCKSDERPCTTRTTRGEECVKKVEWCNGRDDCSDGSDEVNCATAIPEEEACFHEPNQFYDCKSTPRMCIPYDQLCTNTKNSRDCVQTVCHLSLGPCKANRDHCQCRNTTMNGTVCRCANGFESDGDGCKDINECAISGSCDQLCTNTPGSFICQCHIGYVMTENHKCRAIGSDPQLLISNRAQIRRFDLITNQYEPIVIQLDSAVAMDFLHRNRTLIWSDVAQEKILICQISGTMELKPVPNVTFCENYANATLIEENVHTPDGLAVDWVHGLLFWTDTGLDTISVLHLETRLRTTLITEDLDEPRAIAVDPSAGLIFWTDWGVRARIERAGMNGHDRKEVISGENVKWPNGLAVDMLDRRIYWADAKAKAIFSTDYRGEGMRVVLQSHTALRHPFSLTVFEERLYWTDWEQEGVMAVNKFTGKNVTSVVHGMPGPMTVRVYHEMAQPEHPNKCIMHACSDLCLPKSRINVLAQAMTAIELGALGIPYTCRCRDGFVPSARDQNRCLSKEQAQLEAAEMGNAGQTPGTFSTSTLFLLFVLAAIVVMMYVWYRRRPTSVVLLNFDNPVYRRTVEDADMDPFTPRTHRTGGMANVSNGHVKVNLDDRDLDARATTNTTSLHVEPTDSMTAPLTSSMA